MSSQEYKVKVLHPDPNVITWDYPLLPKPPLRCCVISPSNTGKSVLISYMFGSDELPYKKYYGSNTFIFSPSAKLGSMEMPHVKKENIFDSFDVNIIMSLWREQDMLIEKYGRSKTTPILLIFDDVVSDMNSERKEVFKKLAMHGRHSGFSWVLASQQYRSIPKPVRMNCTNIILLNLSSAAERKAISEEQPFNEKRFLSIVDDALDDQEYSFLVVNYANKKERKLQLRFSNQFYDPDVQMP
jgi:hypothetical protein